VLFEIQFPSNQQLFKLVSTVTAKRIGLAVPSLSAQAQAAETVSLIILTAT